MAGNMNRLVHVTGMETVTAYLQQIPKELRTNVIAAAVEAGAKPMVAHIKRYARRSRDTGALYDSIKYIVKKYPWDAAAVAVVGPVRLSRAAQARQVVGILRGKTDKIVRAAPHAHLVEFGHNITRRGANKGQITGFVPAKPFMRPGMYSSRAQVAAETIKGLSEGIEKVRRNLVKKGEHSMAAA